MKKLGIEAANYGELSPWFLLGSIEGLIRAGQTLDVETWNRMVEHAIERESTVAA